MIDIEINSDTIDFAPGTTEQEIIQNVRTICSTVKGSVPMDRNFGINAAVLDMPQNSATALLSAEIIRAVREFEPRADIRKVTFKKSEMGTLIPVISLNL